MSLDFFKNIDKEEIKLRLKKKWTDWQMYQSLALIVGAVFICLIIASLINLYYPKDWTIARSVMDNVIFKAIWIILLGLQFIFFGIQQFKFEYRYSKIQYLILGYSGVIYLILRIVEFKTKRLEIYPIYPDGWLTYLDVPFVLLVLSLFFSMFRDIIPLKKKPVTNTFLEDNPLDKKEDLTQFDNLVKQIEPALFKDRYNSAFSIGIIGPWGSGKSSFIKAVEKRIESENYSKIIYISFSPFLNHNEDRVIHEFFIQLSNELKKRSGKLSNLLLNYSAKLSNAIKDGNPISFLKPSGISKEDESVGELYDEIEKVIRSLNLKIIISIDDLDRLNSKEIIQVLKLIRNTSNFPNVVFLVALDKEYVINALKEEKKYLNKEFLSKFFQVELFIPSNDKREIKVELSYLIKEKVNLDNSVYNELIREINTDNSTVDLFIHNYRDVKVIVNQLKVDAGLISGFGVAMEVNIGELFNLSLLKVHYPSIHYLLSKSWREILIRSEGRLILEEKTKSNNKSFEIKYSPKLIRGNTEWLNNWKLFESGKCIIDGKEYDKKLMILLALLFGNKHARNPLSIVNQSVFRNYFSLTFGKYDISENTFQEILNLDFNKIDYSYTSIDNDHEALEVLKSRMNFYEPENIDDSEKYVKLSIYIWLRSEKLRMQNYDFCKTLNKQLKFYADKVNSNEKFTNVVYSDIMNNESVNFRERSFFLATLNKDLKDRLNGNLKDISKTLNGIFISYLEQYEGEIWSVDNYEVFSIYNNIKADTSKENINQLFIDFIRRSDLKTILYQIIELDDPFLMNRFKVSDVIKEVFGQYTNFLSFIKKHRDCNKILVAEFIDFLELSEILDFSPICYSFNEFQAPKLINREYPKGSAFSSKRQIYIQIHDVDLASEFWSESAIDELRGENNIYVSMDFQCKHPDNLYLVFEYDIKNDKHLEEFDKRFYNRIKDFFKNKRVEKKVFGRFFKQGNYALIQDDDKEETIVSIRSVQPPIDMTQINKSLDKFLDK